MIPFDMTQVTSVANRQRLEAGREAPSLHAAGGAHVIQTAPTYALQGGGHTSQGSQGSGWNEDVCFTLNNVDQHAIAFTNRGIDSGDSAETLRAGSHGALPMVAATLTSNGDAHSGHRDEHGLIPTAWIGSYGGGGGAASEVAPTLQASGGEDDRGVRNQRVSHAMAVRRLTPVECCRLQAFPDDWLDLDPPLADSTKYRMLGNAVCVAVSTWLARRIVTNHPHA